MSKPSKKKCGCCGKVRPYGEFHRLEGTSVAHPFCRPCLDAAVRKRSGRRDARRTAKVRLCAQCGQGLPLRMFHWLRASRTYHSYCRPCHAAYMAERYRRLKGQR